ncbi:DUF1800 domain-containing protein [Siccirubricoccus sp. KC 17139]|uniref:DUF1800 domain-containing protein n=1 Tax=Siccirubricoccus soli TaxID=2899147 RepID=A0ABT1D3V8_9PROT|nr:DUF1800 domain-containing protein [Siccirubricoccus soli]MCO6416618.1 DUF1800 domain-containing protein [Siccirubricoccus soli]MCP2682753.1 DUF1800 domain-containing protein [Siccirubricoccus soli]
MTGTVMIPALDEAAAHRVLARAAYGARPGEAAQLARQGLRPWVEQQLALPAEDAALQERLDALRIPIRYRRPEGEPPVDELRPLTALYAPQAQNWALIGWPDQPVPSAERERPRVELMIATTLRKAVAEAQLRERLVEFWHDHFSVSTMTLFSVLVSIVEHDRQIRAHALGNFRALLEAMATSPAMLAYLSNASSRAGAPNENYARELLELHTLGQPAYFGAARTTHEVPKLPDGRPAGYVDADVWEAARALTGWTFSNNQPLDPGRRLPRTGEFTYVAAWHDPYQKRFLGLELEPFAPEMAHGRAVLDALATHPATARFVCTKLARFLIGDKAPPAAVARAERAFLRHAEAGDQIAKVVSALLLGPEIAAPAQGRTRRPLDFVAAAARALELPFVPTPQLMGQMAQAGQGLFAWASPDGQPVEAEPYLGASALRARWGVALGLGQNRWGTGASPRLAELAGQKVDAAALALARLALGPEAAPAAATIAGVWSAAGRNPRPDPAEIGELAGWVLASPAFQTT